MESHTMCHSIITSFNPKAKHTDDDFENKIQAFLDEKALEFKKMQISLYEEFYNRNNADRAGYKASPRLSLSEKHRKWKQELDRELERKREMRRQSRASGKTSSEDPKRAQLNSNSDHTSNTNR